MVSEQDFRKAIDAEPSNMGLYAAFADWLEEHGDWRADGYKWMFFHGRYSEKLGRIFRWRKFCRGKLHSELSDIVYFRLSKNPKDISYYSKTYYSREAAEYDLCKAIAAVKNYNMVLNDY